MFRYIYLQNINSNNLLYVSQSYLFSFLIPFKREKLEKRKENSICGCIEVIIVQMSCISLLPIHNDIRIIITYEHSNKRITIYVIPILCILVYEKCMNRTCINQNRSSWYPCVVRIIGCSFLVTSSLFSW